MFVLLARFVSFFYLPFWLWMALHCYRRYGGLNQWHFYFFIFPPSAFFYFVVHYREILGSAGRGQGLSLPFGLGLKSRIKRVKRDLRITDTAAARMELAELYLANQEFSACESEVRILLEKDDNDLEALYFLGLCRIAQKDFKEAEVCLKRVLEKDKKFRYGKAWIRHTDCLWELDQQKE